MKLIEFLKRNLRLILYIACAVLVLTGILVIVFTAGRSEGFLGFAFMALGVVTIAIGCSLAFFSNVVKTTEPANFFLYDSKRRTNIRLEELTFDIVNKKMTLVMADLAESSAKAWTENLFEAKKDVFESDPEYLPLVAYKMLYDLADRSDETVWALYLSAPVSLVDAIVKALEANEDDQMGEAFKILYQKADGSYERTQKFLTDNQKYIQNKMLKYIKANIEKF